jgi:hypothetical protein
MGLALRQTLGTGIFGGGRMRPELRSAVHSPEDRQFVPRAQRRSIWDLKGSSHCSIIGTCLSVAELRKIARRIGFAGNEQGYCDYEVHGLFVGQMGQRNDVAIAVQKHLDQKFEGAIRKAKPIRDDAGLLAYWSDAQDLGTVPGTYWAIVTHPHLTPAVEIRVYGEVHMMSHISGASHRGDARELAVLRAENSELRRRVCELGSAREADRRNARKEADGLRKLVAGLEPFVAEVSRLRAALEASGDHTQLQSLRTENVEAVRTIARLERRIANLEAAARGRTASAGIDHVPKPEAPQPTDGFVACTASSDCAPCDLGGACILYVGGRPPTVCRIRDWCRERKGLLLHHDGGVEDSPQRLTDLVAQADIVLFPVDCISHGASGLIKSLCASQTKAWRPLRKSSVTAFQEAVRTLLTQQGSSA